MASRSDRRWLKIQRAVTVYLDRHAVLMALEGVELADMVERVAADLELAVDVARPHVLGWVSGNRAYVRDELRLLR